MLQIVTRAAIVALFATFISLSVVSAIIYWRGAAFSYSAILLAVFIPLFIIFPILVYLLTQQQRLKERLSRLEVAHIELQHYSELDPMSELFNRAAFFEALKALRYRNNSGSLLIIDADFFKTINDQYGHLVGDRAIKHIASLIRNSTRKDDLLGRIGGEEFCVYLPSADCDGAKLVAENIRRAVQDTPFYVSANNIHALTVSIGGAVARVGETNSHMLSRADRSLYIAKRNGRNQVSFHEDTLFVASSEPVSLYS